MRVLVTGASRGLGAAIARAFARHHGAEARIALLGRSLAIPSHPELAGTLERTAREVRAAGATAVPVQVDLRHGEGLVRALCETVEQLGGLDVLVNNASALHARPHATVRQMDLVHQVNARATMLCNEVCAPHLEEARGAIVTLSPAIRLGRLEWISAHAPYTLSKYGMTLATLGRASDRVRANCLWPRRLVATAATRRLEREGLVEGAYTRGRDPDAVAEAVHRLATSHRWNAACLLDEDVLDEAELPPAPGAPLDLFVEEAFTA